MTSTSPSLQKASTPSFRNRSCDTTACSSNSSCFLRRRKTPTNLLTGPYRAQRTNNTNNNNNNCVRERVLSAKLLKLRIVQNQLNDANYHLAELSKENQTLKNLQKRQDKALSRYEGTNADLPRLIRSHEEEIRVQIETNKNLRKMVKDLNEQLKSKNDEVVKLQDKLKHYAKLSKDKGLLEREQLADLLENYKMKLQKAEEQIVVLSRKLTLERKNNKQKLNAEVLKNRQCQMEMDQALMENERLVKLLESKNERSTMRRLRISNPRQSSSNLRGNKSPIMNDHTIFNTTDHFSTNNELKLEPININYLKKDEPAEHKDTSDIMRPPSENIRARLSSGNSRNISRDKEISRVQSTDSSLSDFDHNANSPPSLVTNLEDNMDIKDAGLDLELNTNRMDSCSQATSETNPGDLRDVASNSDELDPNTEQGLTLQHPKLLSFEVRDDNLDFVSDLLHDRLSIGKNCRLDKNGDDVRREPVVDLGDREKLLAALRAIDKGHVDHSENNP